MICDLRLRRSGPRRHVTVFAPIATKRHISCHKWRWSVGRAWRLTKSSRRLGNPRPLTFEPAIGRANCAHVPVPEALPKIAQRFNVGLLSSVPPGQRRRRLEPGNVSGIGLGNRRYRTADFQRLTMTLSLAAAAAVTAGAGGHFGLGREPPQFEGLVNISLDRLLDFMEFFLGIEKAARHRVSQQ